MVELNDNGIIEWSDDDMRERRIRIGDITSIDLKNPAPVSDGNLIYIFEYLKEDGKIYQSVSTCVKDGNSQ